MVLKKNVLLGSNGNLTFMINFFVKTSQIYPIKFIYNGSKEDQ